MYGCKGAPYGEAGCFLSYLSLCDRIIYNVLLWLILIVVKPLSLKVLLGQRLWFNWARSDAKPVMPHKLPCGTKGAAYCRCRRGCTKQPIERHHNYYIPKLIGAMIKSRNGEWAMKRQIYRSVKDTTQYGVI